MVADKVDHIWQIEVRHTVIFLKGAPTDTADQILRLLRYKILVRIIIITVAWLSTMRHINETAPTNPLIPYCFKRIRGILR